MRRAARRVDDRGMKFAAVVVTAAAVVIPMASAKGKPPPQGEGCKPNVTVILKGKLTSDPAAGATSFTMNVTNTNAHGKGLKGLGVTIALDAKTKVRRQGAKTVESLGMDDRANVQLRRCKKDLPLTAETVDDSPAFRVTAQAPKA
jgi:hypothetical protein